MAGTVRRIYGFKTRENSADRLANEQANLVRAQIDRERTLLAQEQAQSGTDGSTTLAEAAAARARNPGRSLLMDDETGVEQVGLNKKLGG